MEGNLRFKIDWASLIVGTKFTVFALFYFVFEGNFQVQAPGDLYSEGRFHGSFFALRVWEAYIWRGLFSEFYGISRKVVRKNVHTKISKGNMGYDQYAVPDTVAVESSVVAFF